MQAEINHDNVGIFIDNSNLTFGICKIANGKRLDPAKSALSLISYDKLVEVVSGGKRVAFKRVYLCSTDKSEPFEYYLSVNGFEVITKQVKRIFDYDSRLEIYKGNMDVEITKDIVNMVRDAEKYPIPIPFPGTLVLASGDSDFNRLLVEDVKSRGIKIVVVATWHSLSNELRKVADEVIFLEDIWDSITR